MTAVDSDDDGELSAAEIAGASQALKKLDKEVLHAGSGNERDAQKAIGAKIRRLDGKLGAGGVSK
jgi:hypothetical protein